MPRSSWRRAGGAVLLTAIALDAGCSASSSPSRVTPDGGGSGGGAGAAAMGGSGAVLVTDAGGGTTADATIGDGPGVTLDGAPDTALEACVEGGSPGPGPLSRVCAAATDNECDGTADVNGAHPNGGFGNGFDDDCDGLVDEGCLCDAQYGAGETRECWLVPASQAGTDGSPVGWCASNSKGTMTCIVQGGTAENPVRVWDGECRGAQPPFADDVCAPGDFDCDGVDANSSAFDCSCEQATVECPTGVALTAPYPDPAVLPNIDGSFWIKNGNPAAATNWQWTVTGGDCDNILPFPTFAAYPMQNATLQAPGGVPTGGLGPNGNQRGYVLGPPQSGPQVWLAFALSGDYLVKGEFDLNGKHYECTVKVQVRAPGIRAEACWTPMPNDVDLHFARLQNPDPCTSPMAAGDAGAPAPAHGWFQTCRTDERGDDCYYLSTSGCTGFGSNPSAWGYAQSSYSACHGWGSRRDPAAQCDNPRLDFDNIGCNPLQNNPNGFLGLTDFCGAENINLDNPKNGERFAIGVHAYSISQETRAHVNIYCNGERRLSLGHNPATGVDPPRLSESVGSQNGGDFWEVATVEAIVDASGNMTDCVIDPVHSTTPKPVKDGSTDVCVDTHPENSAVATERSWRFRPDNGYPASADELCWH